MTVQDTIERKLAERFALDHLEVVNESGGHNVPAGSESHFKVVLVTEEFAGQRLLARHRLVNAALAEELAGPVHALALHTYSGAEWRQRFGQAPMSPPCLGGKARQNPSAPSAAESGGA
ncbi:MAG: BolA/IbaG family iron-sulfur metabolism protein [Pseudomonadales bacterium]